MEELEIKDFSQGMVTYPSAADATKASFKIFSNLDPKRPGLLVPLPGAGTMQVSVGGLLTNVPALPSGLELDSMVVFHVTQPGDSDIVIVSGTKSSRRRFYVWPDPYGGSWTTSGGGSRISNASIHWLELTEAEQVTINTVNNPGTGTNLTITGLSNGGTADYYNKWYLWNNTRTYFDYILDSTASDVIITKYGSASAAAGDVLILMRFPVFKKAATVTVFYSVDSLPTFYQEGENIVIHTGAHNINSGPDLWLGYMNRGFLDDNDFDFNGFHCTHAHPWPVADSDLLRASPTNGLVVNGSSTDPIPYSGSGTDYYIFAFTLLYDGIQESRLYFNPASPVSWGIGIADVDEDIGVTIRISWQSILTRQSDYASGTGYPTPWDRRATAIRIYAAPAEPIVSGGSTYRPTADYFFLEEIEIDASGWTGPVSNDYHVIVTTISGTKWKAAQAYSFSSVNGYTAQKTGANAIYVAQVGGRSFIGPVFDDTKKLSRILFSPIRLSGETGPDVFPTGNRIDVLHQGIYEIVAIAEQFGRLVIFGRNTTAIAIVSGAGQGELGEQLQKVGCISARTVRNIDGLLYFSSFEHMLEIFDGSQIRVPAPSWKIQDIWDGLTTVQKEAAFAGYHKNSREWWVYVNNRVFIYSIRDDNWKEYDTDNTYVCFVEGVNGELFAASSTALYALRAGTPTETLVITAESQVLNGTIRHFRRTRMSYKSPSLVTMTPIDDEQISTLREKSAVLFLPQNSLEEQDRLISMKTTRGAFKLTRPASTDTAMQIESITLAGDAKIER